MIISIDTETYKWNEDNECYEPILDAKEFILGCAITYHRKKFKHYLFKSKKEMKEWLLNICDREANIGHNTYIYAHNMKYDFYGIFDEDDIASGRLKRVSDTPFLWKINCRTKKGSEERGYLLDSQSIFPMPLSEVGELLEIPKLEMPDKITKIEQLEEYLIRDTEIVIKAIYFMKEKLEELGFRPKKIITLGQLSITSWLTYLKNKDLLWLIAIKGTFYRSKYWEKIKPACRGGRNEAYNLGIIENVNFVDINSLYPYIMRNMRFPDLKTEKYYHNPNISEIYGKLGVWRGTIKAPEMDLPYLPIRYKGKLLFPSNTTLRGTWTILELEEALKLGYKLIEIQYAITYDDLKINLFKDYVDEMYELRLKANKQLNFVIKGLLNRIWGKTLVRKPKSDYKLIPRYEYSYHKNMGYNIVSTIGAKYAVTSEYDCKIIKYVETIKEKELIQKGYKLHAMEGLDKFYVKKSYYIPKHGHPIIGALVTANARDYLYSFLKQINIKDLHYCDTDSIMYTNNYGHYDNLFNLSLKLGDWKLVNKNQTAKIIGEKQYSVGEEAKISGVPKKQINTSVIENEEIIPVKRMISFKQAIKMGDLNQAGKFKDINVAIGYHSKRLIDIPNSIDETGEVASAYR